MRPRLETEPATATDTGFGRAVPWPSAAAKRVRARTRLASIDLLRGLVIVLMALDHVRDYFTAARFSPLDLEQTDPPLFLTRWITHFCAPVFVLLAGVSARLVAQRCTTDELRRFLLTRGLWLIVLEFTVVTFAWTVNLRYEYGLVMQVIWALGVSMIALAALVGLPVRVVAFVGLVLVAGHNLLDGVTPVQFVAWAPLWNVLHVQGPTPFGFVLYPLLPWVGVMALGFALGGVYAWDAPRRRRTLIAIGAAAILAFVVLRLANGYGDPQPWTRQATATLTVLSFLNVSKYPPSLLYLLATLGPALVMLAMFETVRGRFAAVIEVFGRVPLFFYVLHIALAHLAAGLIALWMGFGTAVLADMFLKLPDGWGFGLAGVYLAWAGVLATLYPVCHWFSDVKRRRRDWWLAYL